MGLVVITLIYKPAEGKWLLNFINWTVLVFVLDIRPELARALVAAGPNEHRLSKLHLITSATKLHGLTGTGHAAV